MKNLFLKIKLFVYSYLYLIFKLIFCLVYLFTNFEKKFLENFSLYIDLRTLEQKNIDFLDYNFFCSNFFLTYKKKLFSN